MKKLTIAFAFLFLSLIFFTGTVQAANISVTPTTAIFREERVPELNGVTPDFFSESGAVLGEAAGGTACPAVPWRIFFFILVAYLFLLNLNLWHGFNGHPNPRWGWAVSLTALALIGWHYLDRCRTNDWFVCAVVISGFVSYLIYLYFFKQKLKDEDSSTVY